MPETNQSPTLSPEQLAIIAQITVKLRELGHEVTFQHPISDGPLVTTYRFAPKGMAKVKQIEALAGDIALALAVEDVMIRRLPGESVLGITLPNKSRRLVLWRDTIVAISNKPDMALPLNFGVDALGRPFVEDLVALPHLLIAGSTGGGKSTLLSSLIASLMYTRSPNEVQFILADTKQVEFGGFLGAPHLIKRCKSVYETLEQMDWISDLVTDRMIELAKHGFKNIAEANAKIHSFPYIVLVIDELYHLLGGSRGEAKVANDKLSRIVSESRAAGVHVIAATQRPSVDVVSGTIKANFSARLSFRLPSEQDSKTVLSSPGAEHLLSKGDMLYQSPNRPGLTRCHSAWASSQDIEGAVQAATLNHMAREARR